MERVRGIRHAGQSPLQHAYTRASGVSSVVICTTLFQLLSNIYAYIWTSPIQLRLSASHNSICNSLFFTTPRYTTLHHATPHYTTLHYTTLHFTTLHYTTLHYIHSTTTLHCTSTTQYDTTRHSLLYTHPQISSARLSLAHSALSLRISSPYTNLNAHQNTPRTTHITSCTQHTTHKDTRFPFAVMLFSLLSSLSP
jgi:hypothetical protein